MSSQDEFPYSFKRRQLESTPIRLNLNSNYKYLQTKAYSWCLRVSKFNFYIFSLAAHILKLERHRED